MNHSPCKLSPADLRLETERKLKRTALIKIAPHRYLKEALARHYVEMGCAAYFSYSHLSPALPPYPRTHPSSLPVLMKGLRGVLRLHNWVLTGVHHQRVESKRK